MKFITQENLNTVKTLIGKDFDNGAVSMNGEVAQGRVAFDSIKSWGGVHPKNSIAVVICGGISFAITNKTKFLICYEKPIK